MADIGKKINIEEMGRLLEQLERLERSKQFGQFEQLKTHCQSNGHSNSKRISYNIDTYKTTHACLDCSAIFQREMTSDEWRVYHSNAQLSDD